MYQCMRYSVLLLLVVASVAVFLVSTAVAQTETVLYRFGSRFDSGIYPRGSLVFDHGGNLYGTLWDGYNCCGAVFKLQYTNGSWKETEFALNESTRSPNSAVLLDFHGNLFATTILGGTFELTTTPNGVVQTVLNFVGTTGSYASLVSDEAGNLYGTAFGEGHSGIVFELEHSNSSWSERVLHLFAGQPGDGNSPYSNVIFDSAGNLYGTTLLGGGQCNCGIVFELSPQPDKTWKETVLYSFNGGKDGAYPYAGLTLDKLGNLYGTTESGGLSGSGTAFELTPNGNGGWTENILYSFAGSPDGTMPMGNLMLDDA